MKNETDLQHLAHQWGAGSVPFASLNDQDWLETPAAAKAVGHLTQTATLRSVLLLAGPNGVGKSALAGRWMRSLDERLFHPVCLTQATLSGSGILGSLAVKLGKPASFRRERNLQLIEEALAELERRILVVVLDEAQNYTHSTLEEVRLLLGLNLPHAPAFALVLIGDEYLLSGLKLRNHRALYSRLACQVVPRLSQETLAEMVGTTRSRVSFFMNRFRKMGFINYRHGNHLQVNSSLLNVLLRDDDGIAATPSANRASQPPREPGEPPDKDRARRPLLPALPLRRR